MSYMQPFPDFNRRRSITLAQLNEASEERRLRGTMLADELERMNLVPRRWIPVVDTLDGFLFEAEAIKRGNPNACLKDRFLFLSVLSQCTTSVVAVVDPKAAIGPIDEFVYAWFLGRFMEPVVVSDAVLRAAIARVYHPSFQPPPRPINRPEDKEVIPILERVASSHFASLSSSDKSDAVQGLVDLYKEEGHKWNWRINEEDDKHVPCLFCGTRPVSSWYANVVLPRPLRDDPPVFVPSMGPVDAQAPAICQHCVWRDWKAWEAEMEAVIGRLKAGTATERAAGVELEKRFHRRSIRVTPGKCDFCGWRSEGVKGKSGFACLKCMKEATRVFKEAHAAMMRKMDEDRRREEEEKNRPFPPEMREEARRAAATFGERRARAFRMPAGKAPGQVSVEAIEIAELIESAGLDGLRQRHKGLLTGERDVVGERWPADKAISLLVSGTLNRASRARVDEAIVLLRKVMDTGVHFYQYDLPMYDDVTEIWARLTSYLYDYRMQLAGALHSGGLLLHGGSADERMLIAREIHLSRTGGNDREYGIPWVVIGDGEGQKPLLTDMGEATVYIPRPVALSKDEQASLFYRLSPTGPPKPTILGADDELRLMDEAREAGFSEDLFARLYAYEYDLRREATEG